MSVFTSYLRTIEHAITIGTKLPVSWFRGHSRPYKALTPTIYRRGPFPRGSYREYWAAAQFRLRARAIETKVPGWRDYLSWLLLMQHHGTPTRLLDWTESILVALYFAVQRPSSEPGEVWCIRPDALNNLSNYYLCGPDRPAIRYLAAEPLLVDGEKVNFVKRLGLEVAPSHPFAFLPPMEFARMSAQSSRFTIHPEPRHGNLIENVLTGRRELIRYEIPTDRKPALLHDLIALGVTPELLFHSLDGLSKTIVDEIYFEDRGEDYPEPPIFE